MSRQSHSPRPALTVVVPTLDRPERLRACVAAVGGPHALETGIELIVADDGGRVEAAEMAAVAGERVSTRVLPAGGHGPAAARNTGAAAACAELVAFTDDDCEPAPGWAAALVRRHRSEPQALIGGRTVNGLGDNAYSRAAQAITDAALAHHNGGPRGPVLFPSNNIAVPKAAFLELGGFDETVRRAGGEDRDLCERWVERGWPVTEEAEASVTHFHDLDLTEFWRQQSAYGAGAHRHRRTRAIRTGNRRLEPSLTSGVLAIAVRRALAERDAGRLGLLGVWQAANLAGYLGAALRGRSR